MYSVKKYFRQDLFAIKSKGMQDVTISFIVDDATYKSRNKNKYFLLKTFFFLLNTNFSKYLILKICYIIFLYVSIKLLKLFKKLFSKSVCYI